MKFYFEYPIEGTYSSSATGNGVSVTNSVHKTGVNRSKTEETLHRPAPLETNSNGSVPGRGVYHRDIDTKNSHLANTVRTVPLHEQNSYDSVSGRSFYPDQNLQNMHISDSARTVQPPPSSLSVPEFNQVERRQSPGAKGNRHVKGSPSGDRRYVFPYTDSDNSLVSFEAERTCESDPEDFSDTDTDNEWEAGEVTAV